MNKLRLAETALAFGLLASTTDVSPSTMPNGTVEQAAEAVGYGATLGHFTLRQTITFKVVSPADAKHPQQLYVYDYTPIKFSPLVLQTIAQYDEQLTSTSPGQVMAIAPSMQARPRLATVRLQPRVSAEHDFIVVPQGTPMPKLLDGGSEAETAPSLPDQQVSVIQLSAASTEEGLFVEMCQSLDEVTAPAPMPEASQYQVSIVAQETFCNSLGAVEDAILRNQKYVTTDDGSVNDGFGTFPIYQMEFPVPQQQNLALSLATNS